MNFRDIRDMRMGQGIFWVVAAPVTIINISLASFLAFRKPFWKEISPSEDKSKVRE